MPRFFFHLDGEEWAGDPEGTQMPNLDHAKAEALRCAQLIAAEDTAAGSLDLSHAIEVRDEAGQVVARIAFGDTIQVKG